MGNNLEARPLIPNKTYSRIMTLQSALGPVASWPNAALKSCFMQTSRGTTLTDKREIFKDKIKDYSLCAASSTTYVTSNQAVCGLIELGVQR